MTWLCLFLRSILLSLIPFALGSRIAGLRNRPALPPGFCEVWEGPADSKSFAPRASKESDVSIVRGTLPALCLASVLASSTQSAGVGGILPSPVPNTGGGRVLVRTWVCTFRDDDASDSLLILCDLVVGGGPGGGGGRGIPGSQPPCGGDMLRVWLDAREVPALLTTGPAETALLEDGGRATSSS